MVYRLVIIQNINHAYPEESVEKLQEFWKMVYETAVEH